MHRHRQADSILAPETFDRVETRVPSKSDIPDWVALEKACFNTDFYRPHRFSRSQFASCLRNPRAIFFVAVQQGVLLGYIAGYLRARSRRISARIVSLTVAPAVRTKAWAACYCDTSPRRSHNAAARA